MDITLINRNNQRFFSHLIGEEIMPGQGALGVVDEGRPIAAGLFTASAPVCEVDWIAVDEDRRRQGVGRFLFENVKQHFAQMNYSHFLTYYEGNDENTAFLKSLGFSCVPSVSAYAVSCESLLASGKCKELCRKFPGKDIVSFAQLEEAKKRALIGPVEKAGFSGELAVPGAYDPEWSFALVPEGQHCGTLLARQNGEDIAVTLLLVTENNPTDPLKLFAALMNRISGQDHGMGDVVFLAANDNVVRFLERFLEGDAVLRETAGAWSAVMQIGG